jgi:serine/threonine-protein kinase
VDGLRADAHALEGQILSAVGETERAVESFDRAVAISPRDPSASRHLGRAYVSLGQTAKAEETYRAAIAANPNYFVGYEDLGYQYYTAGKYAQAVSEFERVAALAPDNHRAYNYLGALYYQLERWGEAIAMFERSFALQKTYFACSNLGTLYYMDGRFGDAARMYEWARRYPEADCQVVGNLASAYYWMPEERERAMPLFREAIDLTMRKLTQSPGDAITLSMLAGYYSVSRRDSAVYYAEKALTLLPEDPEVLFRAAMVYEEIGERERALVLLGRAISRGYSLKIIEHERQFLDLRRDGRYQLLIAGTSAATKTKTH